MLIKHRVCACVQGHWEPLFIQLVSRCFNWHPYTPPSCQCCKQWWSGHAALWGLWPSKVTINSSYLFTEKHCCLSVASCPLWEADLPPGAPPLCCLLGVIRVDKSSPIIECLSVSMYVIDWVCKLIIPCWHVSGFFCVCVCVLLLYKTHNPQTFLKNRCFPFYLFL